MAEQKPKSPVLWLGLGMAATSELTAAVGVGWYGGGWLDERFGTKPWLGMLGLVGLMVLSVVHIVKLLGRYTE